MEKTPGKKIGIRRKLINFMLLLMLIGMGTGITLGYYWGFNLLRNVIGENHKQTAELLSVAFREMVDEKIKDSQTFATDTSRIESVKNSNLRYEIMDENAVKKYFIDMDAQWEDASEEHPLVKEYLEKKSSLELKEILEHAKEVVEIFITDIKGGLVASSGKTSDFYQADEKWWKEAFNDGKGKIFIGDIEYDESAEVISLTIAVPLKDEKGEVIGVLKDIIELNVFFEPLKRFTMGKTGHVMLVDEKGYALFHEDVKALSAQISEENLQKLSQSRKGWEIITLSLHEEKMLASLFEIRHPVFLAQGKKWKIIVAQEVDEIFLPLRHFLTQAVFITGILALVLIPIMLIFSNLFVRPIKKLRRLAEHIGKGKAGYDIEIKTGDEIEEFADSFKEMLLNIEAKQKEIIHTKTELEKLSKDLEKKVAERVKELKCLYGLSKLLEQPDITLEKIFHEAVNLIPSAWQYPDIVCARIIFEDKEYKTDNFKISEWRQPSDITVHGKKVGVIEIYYLKEMPGRDKTPFLEEEKKLINTFAEELGRIAEHEIGEAILQNVQVQLRHAERMETIGMLASGIAHEVKNPLGIIFQGSEFLSENIKTANKDVSLVIKHIKNAVARADNIIKGLLDFSSTSKLDIKKEDLNSILQKALLLVKYQLDKSHIQVIKNLKKDIPHIRVDKNKIEQAFVNIYLNAIQVMPDGGELKVTSYSKKLTEYTHGVNGVGRRKDDIFRPCEDVAIAEIEDTGPGIPEEILNKVFDPFFSTKRVKGGTGLGLSIVKNIISLHNGKIEIANKPDGKGIKVTVMLKI